MLQLFVQSSLGPKVINIHRDGNIHHLKLQLQNKMGIPIESQRLSTLMGKPLRDDCRLSEYNIQNEQTLVLSAIRCTKEPTQTQTKMMYIQNKFTSFQPHMSIHDASTLRVHDQLDHRDKDGRFVLGTIRNKIGTNLKIHYEIYESWSTKWDIWSDYNLELHRFAHPYSISQRPAHAIHNIKKGDDIDINPIHKHSGWKDGIIQRLDVDSGQIQIAYEWMNTRYLYWVHADDTSQIARFYTTKRTCIKCYTQCDASIMIECSTCKHKYCPQCITDIMHEHLSLLNEIPICVYPDCSEPLNMNNIDIASSETLKKYRTPTTFKEYSNMKHLINGYIRNIAIIPNDIISIILDDYQLYFIKPVFAMTLDVHKICNNQLLCVKCNEYHPTDYIICWSSCHHIICIHCLLPYIADHIVQYQGIPTCAVINCHKEMGENNAYFVYDLWRKSDNKRWHCLEDTLKTMFYTKDKFECSYCLKWHTNDELYTDKKRVFCKHKYNWTCYDYGVSYTASICGHSDCLKCFGKCEICQESSGNVDLVKWSLCEHKYHKRCAQKYIDEWIPNHNSIFDVLIHNEHLIPLCIGRDCNKLLDVSCAVLFGITHYQCKVIYDLRKESILVNDNEKDNDNEKELIEFKEDVTPKRLIHEDFGMITAFDTNI